MNKSALKSSIYAIIGISGIIWFSLAWYSNLNLSMAKDFFGLLPKVVSIDTAIILVFYKWGWKIGIFKDWLVPFPNLSGTWVGKIHSDWIDPKTGEKVLPIPVMLTVNQSYSHINFVMHTGEMRSFSISEGFNIDKERQLNQISYIYVSKPRIALNERSLPHYGSIIFDIIESPEKKLIGQYWTERKTKGEILLTFHSKIILSEIPNTLGKHPVTEPENLR